MKIKSKINVSQAVEFIYISRYSDCQHEERTSRSADKCDQVLCHYVRKVVEVHAQSAQFVS